MNPNRRYTLDAESIASALQKAKRVGPDKYVACCPAHDDKTPSLSVQDTSGKVLVHCHAGCTQEEVIGVLRDMGLWHTPSRHRIKYLENQSLKEDIRRNTNLLMLALSEYDQGVVHTEIDRVRIKRAIRLLEEHCNG